MSADAAEAEREAAVVARRFRFFAETQCKGRSPLYEALSRAVAGDPELCALMAAAPADQRRPALLLAVVHYLLADHEDHEDHALAAYYPSLGGTRALDEQAAPAFRAFCTEHREPIERLLASTTTQTNELRRAACLLLALDRVYAWEPRPLALIEAGASAGLNLPFDRYSCRTDDRQLDGGSGAVTIDCIARGEHPLPLPDAFPPVPIRVGLDLAPIDPRDAEATRWLRAFVWPELTQDHARLDAHSPSRAGSCPPSCEATRSKPSPA